MRLDGVFRNWSPFILERLLDLVDENLMREVLTQAIEGLKTKVVGSETKWDDRIILPLLEILLLIVDEKD